MRLPCVWAVAATAMAVQQPLGTALAGVALDKNADGSTALFTSLERYARLVDIAYCVGATGTGIAPPFSCASRCSDFSGLRLVSTWNTGLLMRDSCGYIAVDDAAREVVVAFRGTYSLTNTVVDLSTIPQEYEPYEPSGEPGDEPGGHRHSACVNCTVHSGFMASWKTARELVLPAVEAARTGSASSGSYRVHLVGHSLGGAVAALAALEMKLVRGWDVQVTTFGEPCIGNDRLAGFLEAAFGLSGDGGDGDDDGQAPAHYRRVTHRNDPVPLLPLAEWGYRAHAGEIYIRKADLSPTPRDLRLCRGRGDPACIAGPSDGDSILPPLARLKLWELFFAHRDYFWRLGLCVPGGDPADWGRERYNYTGEL